MTGRDVFIGAVFYGHGVIRRRFNFSASAFRPIFDDRSGLLRISCPVVCRYNCTCVHTGGGNCLSVIMTKCGQSDTPELLEPCTAQIGPAQHFQCNHQQERDDRNSRK